MKMNAPPRVVFLIKAVIYSLILFLLILFYNLSCFYSSSSLLSMHLEGDARNSASKRGRENISIFIVRQC